MICLPCLFQTLCLLIVANGAPVVAERLCNRRFALAIDFGFRLGDGQPVFGKAKTWRGLSISAASTALASGLIGIDGLIGLSFAAWAMMGDLASSFVKRRRGLAESSRARILDTVPEALLPAVMHRQALTLSNVDVVLIVTAFLLIDQYLSPLLYKWHLRKRPY